MSAKPLRLATRRSPLALAQSRRVGEKLSRLTGRPLQLVEVTSFGDQDSSPLESIGGTGVFVTAVRQAVLDGDADLAVHSLKDLPTTADPRLRLAAVPSRENPFDALISANGGELAELPQSARVGTGSPRRRMQLLARRPDLRVVGIRGNVQTRLDLLSQEPGSPEGLDAVVLAAAGLVRLGLADRISAKLSLAEMVPAAGQGALAVEMSADVAEYDSEEILRLLAGLASLDDQDSRTAVLSERTFLAATEAGCSAPVGALAEVHGERMVITGVMAGTDGFLARGVVRGRRAEAAELGATLATRLLHAAALPNLSQDTSTAPSPVVETGSPRR